MKAKMETEEGRSIYNLRKIVVEPVIGNIKHNLGFNEFLIRGLDGAKLELNIASIAHNLKKIWIMRGKLSKNNENLFFEFIIDQKIDAPPHLKRCGLIGARFLDAQSADHILKDVVLGRHFDIKITYFQSKNNPLQSCQKLEKHKTNR